MAHCQQRGGRLRTGRDSPGPTSRPARRPRNRRAQLADAAAELFRRHGYHSVGVNDIAAAAGVTGPAVYRHFRGKQDILAHVLLTGMDTFGLVTEEALATARHGRRATRRAPGAPWPRWPSSGARSPRCGAGRAGTWPRPTSEDPEARRRADRRSGAAVRDARPELSPADAELLCWAALSVFGSVAVHHVSPPRRRVRAAAGRAGRRGAALAGAHPRCRSRTIRRRRGGRGRARVPSRGAAVGRHGTLPRARLPRGEHGGHRRAGGMAGPSIYRHFAGKSAMLVAGGYRMADRLARGAERAIERCRRSAGTRCAGSRRPMWTPCCGRTTSCSRSPPNWATCPSATAGSWSGCSAPTSRSGCECYVPTIPHCPSRRPG